MTLDFFPHLTSNVLVMIGVLFVILVLATLITALLTWLKPKKNYTELQQRVRSWWVIVVLLVTAIMGSTQFSIIFIAFVSFLALKEYLSLISTRRADRRVLFWAYLTIPLQYYWIHIKWYGMFIVFIPVYLFLFLPFRMIIIGETKDFLKAISSMHWGVMTTVFALSHVACLLMLNFERNPAGKGAGLVLFLIFLTQFNDVAQYIWGKSFGRHKIIPKVSPNKTVEGFLGGVLTTTLLSVGLAPYLTPIDLRGSIAVGLMIALGGFVGDVVMSAIKRDFGVKDAGAILPGHGGILDRIDSLFYTAPLFFHFVDYYYYN
jgi:phosphatidate cytidylyltransferase